MHIVVDLFANIFWVVVLTLAAKGLIHKIKILPTLEKIKKLFLICDWMKECHSDNEPNLIFFKYLQQFKNNTLNRHFFNVAIVIQVPP